MAEAEEQALNDFLGKLKQNFSRYIDDAEIEWQEAKSGFKDFTVKY